MSSVTLPRHGDSTTALFYLKMRPEDREPASHKVYITLWYEGAFIAKVSREIVAIPPSRSAVPRPALRSNPPTAPIEIDVHAARADLTIWENPEGREIIIDSPYLQPQRYLTQATTDLAAWIQSNYLQLSQAGRSVTLTSPLTAEAVKTQRVALAKGFGRELWRRAAPVPVQQAFWRLTDQLGAIRTIQIFSSNPLIPWELMRPSRPDGSDERDFLGIDVRIARWHVAAESTALDRPPQQINLNEIVVVAPEYTGAMALPNQAIEIAALKAFPVYRAILPQVSAVANVIGHYPEGIIHFSGHGDVRTTQGRSAQYVVRLQDGDLDTSAWAGMTAGRASNHPLVFLNACETGLANQVANFVEGWAPKVLEAGAGGYVGTMWAVGDKGAAEFARQFYDRLRAGLGVGAGRVNVADLIRMGRAEFNITGDPSYLAYVYYGDPSFAFLPGK